jgi:hypothetical protein
MLSTTPAGVWKLFNDVSESIAHAVLPFGPRSIDKVAARGFKNGIWRHYRLKTFKIVAVPGVSKFLEQFKHFVSPAVSAT